MDPTSVARKSPAATGKNPYNSLSFIDREAKIVEEGSLNYTESTSSDFFQGARDALAQHGLIAYPTEAVFGLGCAPYDELAVRKLLALKQRPEHKGLILIAADYSQLLDYVDDTKIPQDKRFSVFSHWPGPVTLVLPARPEVPRYLRGDFDTIAVRVTAFEPVRQLCRALKTPLVSTSANYSGKPPLRTAEDVRRELGHDLAWIMEGATGGREQPSMILNPLTGETLR
ncbi:Sua5/YciO/YrdC/YwlC family protein [Aliidiomarina sanyensis]|uniref:Threonylcarbamoyl-AMP synthase n=1 Tax=Aliidiomarina sanyensis TaxID=1249555 RepID=A0A432WPY3_9GAMM|nr:Sua5/YciO/YrdC/YwlC family protein [Aliidiomarina sanyensis]RUO35866.1 L-threonylcarbamoyladenylate synthase type 1 TsaC [Aliidiomarina sanyensis]